MSNRDELAERARKLSSEGKTYPQIAQVFDNLHLRLDDEPTKWTRALIEGLLSGAPDQAPAIIAAKTAPVPKTSEELLADIARDTAATRDHAKRTAFWTAYIGWVFLIWGVLSIAFAIWAAVEYNHQNDDTATSALSSLSDDATYDDCIADDSTSYDECQDLK